ncbi:MAG: CHASE3 domain-containing protein [Gammaproteobacteria bacterium]
MARTWSFGKKIGAGFAALVALTVMNSIVTTYALRSVVATMDQVISVHAPNAISGQQLRAAAEAKASAGRGFLLARENGLLDHVRTMREEFARVLSGLKERTPTPDSRRLLEDIEGKEASHQAAMDRLVAMRKAEASVENIGQTWKEEVQPQDG